MPLLPHELNEEILSYLVDDFAALKACSTASFAFTHICQKTLLAKISLEYPLCEPTRDGRQFQVLLGESPHIAEYIRYLAVVDNINFLHNIDWFSMDQDATLRFCLPRLHKLKGLGIQSNGRKGWGSVRGIFPGGFFDEQHQLMQFPSIEYLDLERVPQDLINYCPNLKHLYLSDSDPPPEHIPMPVMSMKKRVYLESFRAPHPDEPLTYQPPESEIYGALMNLTRLKRLEVVAKATWSHAYIAALLNCCADSLEILEIRESFADPETSWKSDYRDPTNWRALKSLKAVHLRVVGRWRYYSRPGLDMIIPPWVVKVFQKLSSSSIEQILLEVRMHDLLESEDPVMLWIQLLSTFIARKKFPGLRCLHVLVSDKRPKDFDVNAYNRFLQALLGAIGALAARNFKYEGAEIWASNCDFGLKNDEEGRVHTYVAIHTAHCVAVPRCNSFHTMQQMFPKAWRPPFRLD